MYCPTCGSEERQLSQYCRACGTDLRAVRNGLEKPDSITASAESARDQIGRAIADKIREVHSTKDLKKVAEDVLPQIEKFLESPEDKRLRRIRAGVVMASMGLGGTIIATLLSAQSTDFLPVLIPAMVMMFIGLGVILNGILFTLPRKEVADLSLSASSQNELDRGNDLPALRPSTGSTPATHNLNSQETLPARASVTEHTTHRLKSKS